MTIEEKTNQNKKETTHNLRKPSHPLDTAGATC